ncbi:Tetranectin [Chionoecetes opilio]|uniref:Tetranectin n=1 Tax=Chionoecetes opilio TaxID=41210 RepID=A0A8J4XKR4_CHIOP|nr:Tetranectin [Chionoecetes opilio]
MICHLVLGVLLGGLTVDATTERNSSARVGCAAPFVMVGERCIHIDYATQGTWGFFDDVYCIAIGGDNLAKVDDANFFGDLVQYIKNTGWNDALYWIGATDAGHEGHWVWPNGAPVEMGTPFWGTYGCYNQQYPDGLAAENCAILDGNANLYFNDFNCDDTTYSIFGICEKHL